MSSPGNLGSDGRGRICATDGSGDPSLPVRDRRDDRTGNALGDPHGPHGATCPGGALHAGCPARRDLDPRSRGRRWTFPPPFHPTVPRGLFGQPAGVPLGPSIRASQTITGSKPMQRFGSRDRDRICEHKRLLALLSGARRMHADPIPRPTRCLRNLTPELAI